MKYFKVKLSSREAELIKDMVANRLASVQVVDREDAKTIHDLVQTQRAIQQAEHIYEA